MRAVDMKDIHDAAPDRHVRLENFVAALTSAAYSLVLRRGLKGSWLEVELGLWRALAQTVQKWARRQPSAASADELEAWREALLVGLTESAFSVARDNGTEGPAVDLEVGLYRAVRRVTRRYSRVRKSE